MSNLESGDNGTLMSTDKDIPLLKEDQSVKDDSLRKHEEAKQQTTGSKETTEELRSKLKNSIFERCGCSSTMMICISHALSAWGDRMWMYAISIFLIALTPGSFMFTAAYGVAVALSVVTFGALVGDWIDVTPRLQAARFTIVVQNVAVIACALVVLILFDKDLSHVLFVTLAIILVLLAIVARLATLGTTIAIERDWVVVIAQDDEFLLADTNAILRRIDLTSNILAPVSTGLILGYGSMTIGILFIAGWNIISVTVAYTMLSAAYYSCPALAIKTVDESRLAGNINTSKSDVVNLEASEKTVLVPESKRNLKNKCCTLVDNVISRIRVIHFGLKLFFKQRVALAGIALSCLFLTVTGFDAITTAYAYSQHVSAMTLGLLTGAGALTGIFGTFMFPRLRKKVGLVKTGIISNSIQLFFLLFCVASIWAPGHPGHLLDPGYHGNSAPKSTEVTNFSNEKSTASSNFSKHGNVTLTLKPTAANHSSSIFSRSNNSSRFDDLSKSINPSTTIYTLSTTSVPIYLNNTGNNTILKSGGKTNDDENDGPSSIISICLLMGGIVFSRIGLWTTDLTITQLFQETVPDQERGIVSGVQNSFNSIMDVAHFAMVTAAPKPEQFGILILISVGMMTTAFGFYLRFAWKNRSYYERSKNDSVN